MFSVTVYQKLIHGRLGLSALVEVMHRMELDESCGWRESRDNGGHIYMQSTSVENSSFLGLLKLDGSMMRGETEIDCCKALFLFGSFDTVKRVSLTTASADLK